MWELQIAVVFGNRRVRKRKNYGFGICISANVWAKKLFNGF
jgi:hypothetical protein